SGGGSTCGGQAECGCPSCSSCSAPACGCGNCGGDDCSCGHDECLFGIIAPTSLCFADFISPMTNPVFFEDPRTLTEARVIYLRHKVPLTALGGEINLFACQLRAALNDRLSIIATKDGYATSTNPLINDGWADVSAGLKYNLYSDYENQQLLSAGATFELPVGSTRTQQGNGDGLFNLFLTGGAQLGLWHWVSGAGLLLPTDSAAESTLTYWSNHWDRRLGCSNIYFLTELNWYHWTRSGRAFNLAPIEGGDLFNLGSTNVAGNDIVTGAFGLKYAPTGLLELGIAWEAPLTDRRDVIDNRLTIDCILRY
ncbi:MAG: hypothetical protein AB7O38_30870, partial [Pirellulaceae bacterium]